MGPGEIAPSEQSDGDNWISFLHLLFCLWTALFALCSSCFYQIKSSLATFSRTCSRLISACQKIIGPAPPPFFTTYFSFLAYLFLTCYSSSQNKNPLPSPLPSWLNSINAHYISVPVTFEWSRNPIGWQYFRISRKRKLLYCGLFKSD